MYVSIASDVKLHLLKGLDSCGQFFNAHYIFRETMSEKKWTVVHKLFIYMVQKVLNS